MRNNRQNQLIIGVMFFLSLWSSISIATAQENTALEFTVYEYELELPPLTSISGFHAVAWSPAGKYLAISGNSTIWLYDADTLEQVVQLDGHVVYRGVFALAWNPDGSLLASASRDKTVRIWDVATGETITVYDEFEHGITSIDWSPDGNLLAITTLDDIPLKLINPLTGQTEKAFHYTHADGDLVNAAWVSWSPNPNQIIAQSSSLGVIFDVETEETVLDFSELDSTRPTTVFEWSPNGSMIAMNSGPTLSLPRRGFLHTFTGSIWDAETGELILDLEGVNGAIASLAWSPDGRFLAANSWDSDATDSQDWITYVWEVETWQTVAQLESGLIRPVSYFFTDSDYTLAWSPDSRQLAIVGNDNLLRIWTFEEGD